MNDTYHYSAWSPSVVYTIVENDLPLLLFFCFQDLPYDTLDSDKPSSGRYLKPERPLPEQRIVEIDNGGEHALINWKRKLVERKRNQKHVASKYSYIFRRFGKACSSCHICMFYSTQSVVFIFACHYSISNLEITNRTVNNLVMSQSDSARRNLEIKTLIDRTLPLVEHGKGCN